MNMINLLAAAEIHDNISRIGSNKDTLFILASITFLILLVVVKIISLRKV